MGDIFWGEDCPRVGIFFGDLPWGNFFLEKTFLGEIFWGGITFGFGREFFRGNRSADNLPLLIVTYRGGALEYGFECKCFFLSFFQRNLKQCIQSYTYWQRLLQLECFKQKNGAGCQARNFKLSQHFFLVLKSFSFDNYEGVQAGSSRCSSGYF